MLGEPLGFESNVFTLNAFLRSSAGEQQVKVDILLMCVEFWVFKACGIK